MQGRAIVARGRWAIVAALAAAAGLAAVPGHARAQAAVQAASTAGTRPLVDQIPIKRIPGKARRVVLSLGPGQLPPLAAGEVLRASAEIKISVTCPSPGPRCIGRRYDFSPKFSGQLVLADAESATHGSGVYAVTPRFQQGCGQKRPNRNHHCVLTLPDAPVQIPGPDRLPCLASGCHLNLVLDAYGPQAKDGNVVVVGGDRPDGMINPTGGRLNAIVIPPGQGAEATSAVARTPASATIPLGVKHESGYDNVVYSVELDGLEAGDVLDVNALQRTDISAFDLPVFVGLKVILAGSPNGTEGKPAYATDDGQFTPGNGVNCTQGPSPFKTPCSSYKTGVVTVTQTPLTNAGASKPLFVNVLSRTFPPCRHCAAAARRRARSAMLSAGGKIPRPGGLRRWKRREVARAAGQPVSVVQPGGYVAVLRYPTSG
jgi:hypothetical protein